MIVGVTAKTVQQAIRAEQAGADYLGSGPVFGSSTKLNAKPMIKELLNAICHAVSIPVVAIGGINRDNILALEGTDIHGVAVVSGIFAASDIEAECRHLCSMVNRIIK
jgi:thiamine-phosphate pyrophosphorylase